MFGLNEILTIGLQNIKKGGNKQKPNLIIRSPAKTSFQGVLWEIRVLM